MARYSCDTVLQRSPDYASGATEPMHFHTYLNLPRDVIVKEHTMLIADA